MKLICTALALTTALLFSPMIKAEQKLNAFDVEWLKHAAEADLFEIELGTFAQERATDCSAQMLGKKLVADHSVHLAKLKILAAKKGVVLSEVPNPTQVLILRYFVTSKSPDWGYDYAHFEVEDHKNDIAETEDETYLGEDAEVVAFAKETLTSMREHLDEATKVAEILSKYY